MNDQIREIIRGLYPYAKQYGVIKGLPLDGLKREIILEQVREMATMEEKSWEGGRCSGTMYSGDHDHYDFLNRVFSLFSHVNALQRDMCPSMTRFESEIIAMSLDLMHGTSTNGDSLKGPCGTVSSGGTESIINAMLVYREQARDKYGTTRPQVIVPDTVHPAFYKGAHLLDIELVVVPTDPVSTQVDADHVRHRITSKTIALVGSAGNYPYGTIDPIEDLSQLALDNGIGLHVDACLGGFILPWGEQLGVANIPVFDFRLSGVTSISADTHKFGYGLKGTSVTLYRDPELRRYQHHFAPTWKGGAYASYGLPGSRSGGLIAATWAAMVSLGREGYLELARRIFSTAFKMQEAVVTNPELRLMGKPTFCFAFASDEFNIYHVNDRMKQLGWRLNGLQHPSALHMCVTLPQTRDGIAEAFASDLSESVDHANNNRNRSPVSSAIYGGGAQGVPVETPEEIEDLLKMALDVIQAYPF
jgi:glutamate/tyrosine decarboxylase-like PLP-dependent enzyme